MNRTSKKQPFWQSKQDRCPRKEGGMEKFGKILGKIQAKIDYVNKICVIALLVSMVVVVGVNIVLRYVFGKSLYWSEDITTLMYAYLIYFSIPLAYRKGSHIKMDFLVNKLPSKGSRVMHIIVEILFLVSFVVLFCLSINMIRQVGDSLYGGVKYPMSVFYYGIIICCLMMFIDIPKKIISL
jgi:TRAP-type C4-dicarboxylate transport system permease small subunit